MPYSITSSSTRQLAQQDLESLLRCSEGELSFVLRRWERPRLEAVMRLLGNRLGTSDEQSTDFELVLRVAHQLNNLLTAERLLAELAEYDQNALVN